MAVALVLALALQCTVVVGIEFVTDGALPAPDPVVVELAMDVPVPPPESAAAQRSAAQAPTPTLVAAAEASLPPPEPPFAREPPITAALPLSEPALALPTDEEVPPMPDVVAPPESPAPALQLPSLPLRPGTPRPVRRSLVEQPRVVHAPVSPPPQTSTASAAPAVTLPGQAMLASGARLSAVTATLQQRIRTAIQAALRYPAAAAAMQLTRRAQVQLDYQSGAVRNIQLKQSAGTPLLDRAALSAVRDARYPAAPAEIGDWPPLALK